MHLRVPPSPRRRFAAAALLALGALVGAAGPLAAQDDPVGPEAPAPGRAGPVVASVEVLGLRRFDEADVLEVLGIAVGQEIDAQAIDEGLRRAFDTFHLLVTVDVRDVLGAPGSVDVRVHVQELAVDLEPRFVGNEDVDVEELRRWIDLEPGGELYFNQIARAKSRLLAGYEREGYQHVEIDVVTRAGGDGVVPDVIFEIREGPQTHVRGVEIHGNESLPDRGFLLWRTGLRKYADVELRGPRLWFLFKDPLVMEDLQGDLVAMRRVYRERGWMDAVVEVDRLEYSDDKRWVTIHVMVDEGARYQVASLGIEAVERVPDPQRPGFFLDRPAPLLFPEEELLALCDQLPGETYSELAQADDLRALASFYGDRGYVLHPSLPADVGWEFLDPLLLFDYERKEVQVTYRLHQGQQLRIRDISFEGTGHTRDRVVRRLLSVFPGELANLNEIQRSLNRLRGTGFFSDPMRPGEHPEPTFRFDPTGDPGWIDLAYVVEEGQVLEFNLSGGAGSSFGLFGQVSLRLRNFDATNWPSSWGDAIDEIRRKEAFHGAGQDFQIQVSPGTEVSRYKLRFHEPDIFQRHIDRISLTYELEQRLRIFRTHDERRLQTSVRFGRQLTPDSSVSLGFGVGRVDVDDLQTSGEPSLSDPIGVPTTLALQEGSNSLGWTELGYTWRVLDNALDPRDGQSVRVLAQLYHDALGSDFDFAKGFLRADVYRPLGEGRSGLPNSVAFEMTAGVASAFGDSDFVPYTERFFLGGSDGPRGFDYRGVGPNQNGFPLGGETMVNATLEYRVPLLSTVPPGSIDPVESVRGILFFDAGVLDEEDWQLDLSELRTSVGFGVGLTVPLPLMITFGFPLSDGFGDRKQTLNFTIGF